MGSRFSAFLPQPLTPGRTEKTDGRGSGCRRRILMLRGILMLGGIPAAVSASCSTRRLLQPCKGSLVSPFTRMETFKS